MHLLKTRVHQPGFLGKILTEAALHVVAECIIPCAGVMLRVYGKTIVGDHIRIRL